MIWSFIIKKKNDVIFDQNHHQFVFDFDVLIYFIITISIVGIH